MDVTKSRITEPHQGPTNFTICSGWFCKGGFDCHVNFRRLNIYNRGNVRKIVCIRKRWTRLRRPFMSVIYARKVQARKHVKSTWQWNSTLTKTSSVKFINHDDNFPRLYPSLKNKSFSQLSYLRMDLLPTELFPCTFIRARITRFLNANKSRYWKVSPSPNL